MTPTLLTKFRSLWLILTSRRYVAASLDDTGRMKVIRTHSSPEPVTPLQLAKDMYQIRKKQ